MLLRVFYGGTFDPVHNGHLAIARAARDVVATTVWMMPAADPPHRSVPGASAEQRAAMLDLAVHGQGGLRVDRREMLREGRSYTIDTIRELRERHGDAAPLAFVVGADSFLGLPQWKQGVGLLEAAHWIVAERPGSPLDEHLPPDLAKAAAGRWTLDPTRLQQSSGGCVLRLRQPLHDVSASQIRRRIAAGETWHHLLPPAVAEYIVAHGLYGATRLTVAGRPAGV